MTTENKGKAIIKLAPLWIKFQLRSTKVSVFWQYISMAMYQSSAVDCSLRNTSVSSVPQHLNGEVPVQGGALPGHCWRVCAATFAHLSSAAMSPMLFEGT